MSTVKESKSQRRELGNAVPPPFIPVQAKVSFPARLCWRFTSFGRARLNLWLALRSPNSGKLRTALAARLPGLQRNLNDKKPKRKSTLQDILLFLAWSDLQTGAFADGMRQLAELDRMFPASTERLALRWDLMQRLQQSRSSLDYQNQAGLFLSDALAADFGGAVLETLRVVYTDLTWELRLGLADSAHASLTADPRVRAAVIQWQCPALFASLSEAHSWMQRISPEHLDFAPGMKADAVIALGRGAEWDRDWAGMEARAREALQIVPDYPEAVFLLTRSMLHQPGRARPEELWSAAIPDEPRWQRLRLQRNLHEHGSLMVAEDVIARLPEAVSAGDLLELDLSIQLIESPLTELAALGAERIAQCADLSSQLQNLVEPLLRRLPFFKRYCGHCEAAVESFRGSEKLGTRCPNCQRPIPLLPPETAAAWLPWTEVNLALKEIHIDRSYTSAFRRLENRDLESYAPARLVAQIARLLAGSPKFSGEKNTVRVPVFALANALRAVTGQVESAGEWNQLRTRVSAALAYPFLREFPALIAAGEILTLAVRFLGGDESAREDTLRYTVPEHAPLWAVWLFSRLVQLCCWNSDFEAILRRIPLASPAVAWFMVVWCYNYGKLDSKLSADESHAMELLNQGLPPSPLLTARILNYRNQDLPANYAPPKDAFAELGELCGEHARREMALELDFARSRSALANGEPAAAASQLLELIRSLDSVGSLATVWWLPLILFWLGVAQAQEHDGKAAGTFESLLDGPCAGAARGQLALLALRDGSLDDAARWIAEAPEHVPSVRYAEVLLLARRGKLSEARQWLESEDANLIFAGTSYALPAWRLMAALEERRGNREESERLHAAILASHPGDAIASVRQGRILIETAYPSFRATGTPPSPGAGLPPKVSEAAGAAKIAWWKPYATLHDLMYAPGDGLPERERAVSEEFGEGGESVIWRQLLAHRFLRANDPARALQTLDIPLALANLPRWFAQARLILTAWRWLTRISQDGTSAEACQKLQKCLRALIPLAQDRGDSPAALWGAIVERALQVQSTGSLDTLIRDSQPLGVPPFSYLPQLWSETAQQRRLAAEALLQALSQDGTGWNEEQKLLLSALAAWAAEADDTYVEQYSILEPVLDDLPVRGRDLWVPAALIRFSKSDWKSLAGDRLPDCIADMSDPYVCLIVELADARAAAADLRKPAHAVAQRIKGIHNNLAALVERIDSQRSGNGS